MGFFFFPPFCCPCAVSFVVRKKILATRYQLPCTLVTLLIQRSLALCRPTQTDDLLLLDRELVVIRDLLAARYRLLGVNDDLLLRLHSDDLCIAVGLEARKRLLV